MMLRSSSTPILGSLLSSYSESPNHGNHSEFNPPKNLPKKFSFNQTHSFPNSSPSINTDLTSECSNSSRVNGFRRALSDGNLEGLVSSSCNTFDEFNNHSISAKNSKFPRKPHCSVLQSIPSYSVYNPDRRYEDDDDDEEDEEEQGSGEEAEEETSKGLSLENSMEFMYNCIGLQERNSSLNFQNENENVPSKMHLAMGLGSDTGGSGFNIGGRGNGGHNEYEPIRFGDDGSDEGGSMEEYYKEMVVTNPGNSLVLRNYAEFLHKSDDLFRAEEYYSRAILADPGDGEILSQYAQLTWELHHDEERALSYFQRAVHASPENSHVHAAYANFLWDKEEEEDDHICNIPPTLHQTATAAVIT